jgi:phosphoribosylanthranilate isomerase
MTKIKLCGLSRRLDIETANELKPDYIGFVLWSRSSRYVFREKALELKRALLPEIKAVGVFVDEDPEVVAGYLKDGIIDAAQLHGKEDASYIRSLRSLAPGKEIIKALQIKDKECFDEQLKVFGEKGAEPDFFLLDSGTGSGQTFNWDIIRDADIGKPFFLAGGLDPTNVAAAVEKVRPFAVDVSSGIETEKVKDVAKMRAFVEAVRVR